MKITFSENSLNKIRSEKNWFLSAFSRLLLFGSLLMTISGCGLERKYVYFNHGGNEAESAQSFSEVLIQSGDRLEIKIAGLEPESALPFYFSLGSGVQNSNLENPPNVFFVNQDGEVDIPVLGKVKVENLKIQEAEGIIRTRLQNLIKVPVVQIRIFNFMVAVLGEVKTPGYYRIQNNRINILELIAMAGDVNPNGSRQEILVWRKEASGNKPYRIDLTSRDLFRSPAFNIRQNDVVYIRPNKSGLLQPTLLKTTGPIAISLLSVIFTTVLFIIR